MSSNLFEDAQHSGHKSYKKTPRPLDSKDIKFFDLNRDAKQGDEVILFDGTKLKGSSVLQWTKSIFQYSHIEDGECHIESVEIKEGRWNSLHLPQNAGKFIPK